MLLNNRANATSSFLNLTNIILQQEFEDSIVEETKSNIIKRYFEKRKKKKEIKEGQLSLESDRIKDLLNQKRLNFREFTTVHLPTKKRGETKIGDKCYFMTMSHIGHDCVIENSVTLSNNVNVAGNTHIMNSSILGLNAIIHQDQIIGSYTMIAMGTNIGKNIIVKLEIFYSNLK